MASALSRIGGHGTSEGGDGLKVLPLLQLMLRVKPCWAICMMVQDVGSLLGRAGCRLRRNGGEEANPPCSGAHPDWKCSRQGSALAVACRTLVLKLRNPKDGWVTGMADIQ